ncbi:MAG: hypothetical protein NT02SARS_0950 [SAR86 cluster bacterium SAR86B]|uniref:Uncharacterized protein n=1 Tax=SAR86 cluster bacterium SAR86B TaxID=1123867 RepID=J5KJV9_9GAMM|nr:MAG: hypothetical protein NT02SARS_0950 [SAR86 cluster bacterium SAR86B]
MLTSTEAVSGFVGFMVVFAALNCFAATKIIINPATIVMYPNKVGSSIENLKISFVKNITNKNTIVTIGGGINVFICIILTNIK